ncbi:MAG: hypothetical protein F4Z74_10785 [Acidobacteria bacterium]|nr:hypothetical protein [Acidobacteriota bacterium]MYE44481.1 hypothetical protein [Acidobacteriota bacterium]
MRNAFGSFLVAVGAGLALNFLGAADRLQQVAKVAWALAPVIGLGLTVFGGVLLAPGGWRAYLWLKARQPTNKFRADEPWFETLYERWSVFEANKRTNGPTESRLLLVEDTMVLLKKHGIPSPSGTDPDILWKTLLLVSLGASKAGDLNRARKQPAWLRGQLLAPVDRSDPDS